MKVGCLFFAGLLLAAAPVWSYTIPTRAKWSIDVSVSGVNEINILGDASAAAYQGEGIATIEITASYTPDGGESFNGVVAFSVGDQYGRATWAYENGYGYTTATATIDLSTYNATNVLLNLSGLAYKEAIGNSESGGFSGNRIYLYKKRVFTMASGDDQGNLWVLGKSVLTVWLLDVVVTPKADYEASDYALQAVVGESVTPTSPSFAVDPSSASTNDQGIAAFNFYPTISSPSEGSSPGSLSSDSELDRLKPQPTGWFTSPCTNTPLPRDEVTLTAGTGQKARRNVIAPYARITSFYGDVRVKGSLGGDWLTATTDCNLGKGDTVFLGPMDINSYQPNSVTIEMYDRSSTTVEPYFTKTGTNLLIKLGDTVETQEYTILNDVRNLAYDVYANPREWAKAAVTKGIAKGVSWATGGYGWLASKGAGIAVKYGIKKMDDWATAPPLRAPMKPVTTSDEPGQAAAPTPLDAEVVAQMSAEGEYNSDLLTSFRADGTADIINRGEARVMTDGTNTVTVPPWSTVSVDFRNAGAPSAAVPMIVQPYVNRPNLSITPSDSSTVTTLQPKVTIDYSGSIRVMPTTLTVRVNGYLVTSNMNVGATQTIWYPSPERPLVRGQNIIRASIMSIAGAVARNFSRITASGALPAPSAPRVYAGRTKCIVVWDRVRDTSLVGYKVFRSTTATGTATEISSGTTAQTVFVDQTPLAGTNWYRIAGITSSGEQTALSTASSGALRARAAQQTPPAVTGLTAANGEAGPVINFTDASSKAFAFLIERQAAGTGPFTNVLTTGFVARPPFTDSTVTNGVSYVYRVTPLGVDLLAGPAATAAAVIAQDVSPDRPQGLTVDIDTDGAHVEWNPSSSPDLAGYHVERITPGGSYTRLTSTRITAASYFDAAPPAGLYGYRIIAVDTAGHESAPSITEAGYVRPALTVTTPTNLRAMATTTTKVEVSWDQVPGASYYVVERKAAGSDYQLVGNPTNHWFTDTSATAGKSYLYRVKATGQGGNSAYSAPDVATTIAFTDWPLAAGTRIKALHFSELRTAIDAVRALAGLGAHAYGDMASPGAMIRAVHVTQLRTALEQACSQLGLAATSYTDASPAGVKVKAAHFQQLRDRLQ